MAIKKTYETRAEQASALAALVAGQLRSALEERQNATISVAGGTTPSSFLTALSGTQLDWSRIIVIPTDERCVPVDHERSNAGMIRQTLLQGEAAKARYVHLPDASGEDIAALLPLDVCVLGMGADCHIASLFPGADRLDDALSADAPPLLPITAPGAPEPRITLTAPVLLGARHLHVLIAGDDKRAALARAEEDGPVAQAPVRLILNGHGATQIHMT